MTENIDVTIYTVGHSNHSTEKFVSLLTANGVTAVADVRSTPFSRRNPQFNRDALAVALKRHEISYVFVGKELGARTDDPSCYENGQVRYARLADTSLFKAGIERILMGSEKYRVALMCAEKEPLNCHRTLLVSRALEAKGAAIMHILSDGSVEPQQQTMSRLVEMMDLPREDMFKNRDELVNEACALRESKIAIARPPSQSSAMNHKSR